MADDLRARQEDDERFWAEELPVEAMNLHRYHGYVGVWETKCPRCTDLFWGTEVGARRAVGDHWRRHCRELFRPSA